MILNFIASAMLLTTTLFAQQYKVAKSVVANGGTVIGNQDNQMTLTVGQTIIGQASGPNFTMSSGFWQSQKGGPVSVEQTESDVLPKEFRLEQNYPNPFNPTTTISFSIAKSAKVKLTLFDLLGRKVLTLRDERMQPGGYKFTFEAADLPSGVYFYHLFATDVDNKNHVFTRKLTLIK